MQNYWICGWSYWKSLSKLITGAGWSLNPLAKTCAKYLLSFDNNATDYFIFNAKFFIITNTSNSKRDFDCLGSDLASILFKSTSAKNKHISNLAFIRLVDLLSAWKFFISFGDYFEESGSFLQLVLLSSVFITAFCIIGCWLHEIIPILYSVDWSGRYEITLVVLYYLSQNYI